MFQKVELSRPEISQFKKEVLLQNFKTYITYNQTLCQQNKPSLEINDEKNWFRGRPYLTSRCLLPFKTVTSFMDDPFNLSIKIMNNYESKTLNW